MPIGDSISEPIPAVGTSGTSYATQLVAFLSEVRSRLESKVALTSLLAGLFDLANNGIANAQYVSLYEQVSAPTTPVGSIQNYGGELYYVSASGAVRITNGGALDVVGANGISGDYAAPAEFRYDLGATQYQAYSDTGTTPDTWAYLGARAFDIYGTATSTTRVRLAWAGGASYTLTIPTTPPGTQQLLQMSSAGAVTASNTLGNNENITLQGTGHLKHGTYSDVYPVAAGAYWMVQSGAPPAYKAAGTHPATNVASSANVLYPLHLGWDKRNIKSITVYGRSFIDVTTLSLAAYAAPSGGAASLSAVNLTGGTTGTTLDVAADGVYAARTLTLTSQIPWQAAGGVLWLRVQTTAGGNFDIVSYAINYDVTT